jgi:hypothetical protein
LVWFVSATNGWTVSGSQTLKAHILVLPVLGEHTTAAGPMLVPIHDLTTLNFPNNSRGRAGTSRNMVIALARPPASHRVCIPDKSGVLQAWVFCIVHPSRW